MKAVPILVITNAVALGLGLMAYIELDDLKSQRGSARQSTTRTAAQGNDYYDTQIRELKKEIARLAGAPAKVVASPGETARSVEPGKAIDRSYPTPENFDEEVELARPDFDYFRERVRLAQDENEKEDRLNREIDRLDQLITSNRIGPLDNQQKETVAKTLLDTREKTRFIWRGLRERDELTSLPRDQQREAFRTAYRKEQDAIRAEAQKSLEQIMPAADAETLLSSARGGDFSGRSPRRPTPNR